MSWPANASSIQTSRVQRHCRTRVGVRRFSRPPRHLPFPHAAQPCRNPPSRLILSHRPARATCLRPRSSRKAIRHPSNSTAGEMISPAGWREFEAMPFARPPAASEASTGLPAGLGKSSNFWSGATPSFRLHTISTESPRRLRAFRGSFCRRSSQGLSMRTLLIEVQDRHRTRMNASKF